MSKTDAEPKKTILVVEDETTLRRALADKLQHEGFAVLEANNGAEGLSQAIERTPDLILLDIVMPVMDGITMLKKLREGEGEEHTPVVVLTNLSELDTIADATESRAIEFLVKSDWKLEDVVEKIRDHLSIPKAG